MTHHPDGLTSFIGRTRELARIRALLTRSRLVTVLGPGGMGKTRVACQVEIHALRNFQRKVLRDGFADQCVAVHGAQCSIHIFHTKVRIQRRR